MCWTALGRSRYDKIVRIQGAWVIIRSILLWAIPSVLVAVLVWTLLPRAGTPPPRSSQPVAETGVQSPPASGAGSQEPPTASPPGERSLPGSTPVAQIHQGDLEGTDATGHQRWRIVADDVTVEQGKQTVLFRRVHATMSTVDGASIVITGDEGRYDTGTREIEITGRVHGTSSQGRQLFADRLHWAPGSGTITGVGHIRLLEAGVVMYADRMVSNMTLGQTQFFGHVHADVR